MKTEIAQILKMNQKVKEEKEDPLYRSITNFAEKLSLIVIIICVLSWMFDIGSIFG
jgi:magnesium-transporting ATPase (P-type)